MSCWHFAWMRWRIKGKHICIWFYFYAFLFSLLFSKRDLISHAQYLKIYFAVSVMFLMNLVLFFASYV